MPVKSFRDLIVWQKAMEFVVDLYERTLAFPREETYGLRSQVRRAGVSIPSNIAEGQARQGTKEFLHYLSIAYASLAEVETQIIIAQRLRYLTDESANALLDQAAEIGRLLNGLRNALGSPH